MGFFSLYKQLINYTITVEKVKVDRWWIHGVMMRGGVWGELVSGKV
jgi:hypothetical protein